MRVTARTSIWIEWILVGFDNMNMRVPVLELNQIFGRPRTQGGCYQAYFGTVSPDWALTIVILTRRDNS